MTVAEGIPCIDLYSRPRSERNKHERLNRVESLWIGGVLVLTLLIQGVVVQDQLRLGAVLRSRVSEIGKLEIQKKSYEAARSSFALQSEKTRGIEGSLAARAGWLRLLQAVSSATTDREALEQCTMDGRTQRSVILSGSTCDLTELQAMLQRLKALVCLKGVRLTETAADKALGPDSVHFRIEAHCNSADLERGPSK